MAGRKSDFTLPTNTLDELFSSQEERDEAKLSKIRDIPLDEIDDFPDHPFKVREDEDMFQLVESIKERGVITPAILQNLAQLKALFEKQWESIVGNCDEFLYLGGNEQSTHKYVSELLGKETIDTNTYGKSEGRSGSYSTNYQISGRELLTPDEVRMLDNRYAILFIRGELPVMDLKYDILKHPNVAYTADGKGGVYQHGEVTKNVATIETLYVDLDSVPEMELSETTYELLSDEDFENLTN